MGFVPGREELYISNMAKGTSSFLEYLSPATKEEKKDCCLIMWNYTDSEKKLILKALWMNYSFIVWGPRKHTLCLFLTELRIQIIPGDPEQYSGWSPVCGITQLWIFIISFQEICLHGNLLLLLEPTGKCQFDRKSHKSRWPGQMIQQYQNVQHQSGLG